MLKRINRLRNIEREVTVVYECCKKEMGEQGEVETSAIGNLSKGIPCVGGISTFRCKQESLHPCTRAIT